MIAHMAETDGDAELLEDLLQDVVDAPEELETNGYDQVVYDYAEGEEEEPVSPSPAPAPATPPRLGKNGPRTPREHLRRGDLLMAPNMEVPNELPRHRSLA